MKQNIESIELISNDQTGHTVPRYGSASIQLLPPHLESQSRVEAPPPTHLFSNFRLRFTTAKMILNAICAVVIMTIAIHVLSSNKSHQTGQPYYAPGKSTWLGSKGESPTPLDYASFFPIIYVILGLEGTPHVRVIVDKMDACPSPLHPELLDEDRVLDTRTLGNPIDDSAMPYKFPIKVCELIGHSGTVYRRLLELGELSLSWKDKSYPVPRVKSNPTRYLLTGDTGLRLKPSNLGLGNLGDPPCNASEIYGIHQCFLNFTKQDLVESQTGSYQGLDEWMFKEIADSAASKDVDVIVHVGDYLYRQGPCPINNTDSKDGNTKDCSAVILPEFASALNITPETVMNFIPGFYGDNWWGWWADFWYPMLNLLKTAPLIPTRGNHEICERGGYGFFIFLSPVAIEDFCLDNFPVYRVPFENEQFIVMDDSIINPLYGGVDKYIPGECPGIPSSGAIKPVQENRFEDPTDESVMQQLDTFQRHFKDVETFSQTHNNNFYVGHRPVLGIGCNSSHVVTLDWTLQQSLGPTTLDRISGIITGHMHWLQALQFDNDSLPAQLVVGNGGTKLIQNYINQSSISYIDLYVGKPEYNIKGRIQKGITMSEFGFGIMERSDGGGYDVTFHTWREDSRSVEPIDFSMYIPRGPRRKGNNNATIDHSQRIHSHAVSKLRSFY